MIKTWGVSIFRATIRGNDAVLLRLLLYTVDKMALNLLKEDIARKRKALAEKKLDKVRL